MRQLHGALWLRTVGRAGDDGLAQGVDPRGPELSLDGEEASLVPRWFARLGAWSWRAIAIGIVVLAALWILAKLAIVVLPLLAALVFTAALRPTAMRLQHLGLPRLAASWLVFVSAFVIVAGIGTFVVYRATVEWPDLTSEVSNTVASVRDWLVTGPLHLNRADLDNFGDTIAAQVKKHQGAFAAGILTGITAVGEFLAAAALTAFITFFFIHDGERIWHFVSRPLAGRHLERIDNAAGAAWRTLSGYIRGSLVIATFNAAVIGITLLILGVPLVAPLTLIVFVTSFLPLVGVIISGVLAFLVTASTQGLIASIVVVVVFVVESQVEGHLLQPFVMGRYVHLHPLVIALALTTGAVLGGIVGAIIAVPVVAMVNAAWPLLRAVEQEATEPTAANAAAEEPSPT